MKNLSQTEKSKYAGMFFILLMVYELVTSMNFFRNIAYYPFHVLIIKLISLLFIFIALIVLASDAFKNRCSQKKKNTYTVMFIIGLLLPLLTSITEISLQSMLITLLRLAFVAAFFLFAVFKLMPSAEVSQAENAKAAVDDQVEYYKNLLAQGIISQEEFDSVTSKIAK